MRTLSRVIDAFWTDRCDPDGAAIDLWLKHVMAQADGSSSPHMPHAVCVHPSMTVVSTLTGGTRTNIELVVARGGLGILPTGGIHGDRGRSHLEVHSAIIEFRGTSVELEEALHPAVVVPFLAFRGIERVIGQASSMRCCQVVGAEAGSASPRQACRQVRTASGRSMPRSPWSHYPVRPTPISLLRDEQP